MSAIRIASGSALALAAFLLPAAAWSQEPPAYSEGTGEAPRGAMLEFKPVEAKPAPMPEAPAAGEASRETPFETEAWLVQTYTAIGRNADGSEVKLGPSDALMAMLKRAAGTDGGDDRAGATGTSGEKKGADPALEEGEEGERQVFGEDERIQISKTTAFPFRAIGYLESPVKEGIRICSGTLIGPRTVLTAAHCLYDNEAKAWEQSTMFYPAINGADTIPYGGFEFETTYVVQGYIDNYQGFYGSALPWDIGVIILKEPIGENLGWLNFADYRNLGDFSVNIVGYPGDKPLATMWRTTCDVKAQDVSVGEFNYDCDTFPGSSGSSVYLYDDQLKQRVVVGVNVAENPEFNTAVRLNPGFIEWIKNLRK